MGICDFYRRVLTDCNILPIDKDIHNSNKDHYILGLSETWIK